MRGDREIECAETVTAERIRSALQHDCARAKCGNRVVDHGLENGKVHVVVDAVQQGDVHTEVLAWSRAVVVELAGAGEKVPRVLVE